MNNIWAKAILIGLVVGIGFGLILNYVPFFDSLDGKTRKGLVIGAIAVAIIVAQKSTRTDS